MEPIASYLRAHRRRSGLSLRELAEVLGSVSAAQISRHERSLSVPGLLTALGYQAVFRTSISELFPGLYRTVETGIEERLEDLEKSLGERTVKDKDAASIARKLESLIERKSSDFI